MWIIYLSILNDKYSFLDQQKKYKSPVEKKEIEIEQFEIKDIMNSLKETVVTKLESNIRMDNIVKKLKDKLVLYTSLLISINNEIKNNKELSELEINELKIKHDKLKTEIEAKRNFIKSYSDSFITRRMNFLWSWDSG